MDAYLVICDYHGDENGTEVMDVCLDKDKARELLDIYEKAEEALPETPHGWSEFYIETHEISE